MCANCIRERGLFHRQFLAFQEYMDCDHPHVVHVAQLSCHFEEVFESATEDYAVHGVDIIMWPSLVTRIG